ncbi:unnamed protein product [Periconia digitata]|uniref:Rhodopsin domain-containing protein n=1 Tax=Periconia digitata TaxID=1303443 RepID=A0A9W4UVB4_9PLEO|nr:unnamed protein product [Periconia digitata]
MASSSTSSSLLLSLLLSLHCSYSHLLDGPLEFRAVPICAAMDLNKPIVPAPRGYAVNLENPHRRGNRGQKTGLRRLVSHTCMGFLHTGTVHDYRAPAGLIGIHTWELTGHQLNKISKITLITTVLYSPGTAFAKMSFLCFYLNLNPAQGFRIGVYITMFVVIGSCVGIDVSLLAACTPFAKNFDVTIKEGKCINKGALYIATAILNIVTDVMVLCLPIPMVLGLQMARSRKMMLILMFSLGSITCVTSAVRVAALPPMLVTKDSSWDTVYPSFLIVVEGSLFIITGALPTMRLFLRHVAPNWVGDSESPRISTHRESGRELQHEGRHGTCDIEDGLSIREIFPLKGSTNGAGE